MKCCAKTVNVFAWLKCLCMSQLCFRILAQEKKVPAEEFNFFLYGGVVVDRYVFARFSLIYTPRFSVAYLVMRYFGC